ncbi:hypothetical protein EJ06DRAFT_530595 [Trichodelitschia bisporula]|uniref:MARVEL domain-containing protein n=1 Tax=Trichodelitschia bisporula TaxID=703511 RepID=A0A6G1HVC3_9PEZI|nr:hypothetical protein EJ06DRAFT_530595 [Trichodelitschia bisporula]
MSRSVVSSRPVYTQRYVWPEVQLNIWTIIVLVAGCTVLGVFASFVNDQQRLRLGIPWLFPYAITVGSLVVIFVIIQLILVSQRRLLPAFMMLFSFIFLVLFLAGTIETAIQLFGEGNVSSNCQTYVNNNPVSGQNVQTLAWLEQDSICSSWYAAFSFWIIGCIFFVWMIVMGSQVARGEYT